MSCSVIALPYAIAWVIGSLAVSVTAAVADSNNELYDSFSDNNYSNNYDLQPCEDVHVIDEKHFMEKSLETAFMDKEILKKTLEEHGVQNIEEDMFGKITGAVDNFSLSFEKMEADKPYFLRISYLEGENAEEKLEDISSEYALNVQEDAYLNIIEKLKANNMEIEDEEVMDDNTIVLTVNLD